MGLAMMYIWASDNVIVSINNVVKNADMSTRPRIKKHGPQVNVAPLAEISNAYCKITYFQMGVMKIKPLNMKICTGKGFSITTFQK
jgi:hypothetical protein